MAKYVDISSTHFRLGWEKSPDNTNMGISMIRYHAFSAAHDRIEAQAKLNKFREQVSPIEEVRQERMGKTKSGLHFIFQTFDTTKSLEWVNMERIGKNIIMDYRFCERLMGDIVDYLKITYGIQSIH